MASHPDLFRTSMNALRLPCFWPGYLCLVSATCWCLCLSKSTRLLQQESLCIILGSFLGSFLLCFFLFLFFLNIQGSPVKPHMNNSIARVGLCQMLTQMKLLCHHCRGGPCTTDATGVLSGSSSSSSSNVYCGAFFVIL